ncbi:uncharacterized protein LOC115672117 [Syzygium oleosum]|uniref:uncharacterized protein LOC115672117 n=1 Tax=Syzygium oleosum TaxID=219896 RepID=UPI0024BA9309|nr:uncharacterized protein LOC115672117 [Syzygium oleosum]
MRIIETWGTGFRRGRCDKIDPISKRKSFFHLPVSVVDDRDRDRKNLKNTIDLDSRSCGGVTVVAGCDNVNKSYELPENYLETLIPKCSLLFLNHPILHHRPSALLALFGVRLGSSSVFINRGLARPRRRWASLHGFKRHPLSSSSFGLTRRRTRTLLSSLSWLFLLSSLRKIDVASRRTWFLSGQGSCQPLSLKKKLVREKILDKQLHSLLEQLVAKQAQAEALVSEVHQKEKELEGLSGLWKRLESNSLEVNATRNRFGRSIFDKGSASSYYIVDVQHKPLFTIGRWDSLQRPALLRSDTVRDSPTDSLRVARDNGLGNADAGVGGFSDSKVVTLSFPFNWYWAIKV